MSQVVVVDSIRTGLAKAHRGTFNLTRGDDLVAHCIDSLLDRNPEVDPGEVEDVIVGAGRQTGEQSANLGRYAVAVETADHGSGQHHQSRLFIGPEFDRHGGYADREWLR